MKQFIFTALCCAVINSLGAEVNPVNTNSYSVVARGPNDRLWQKTIYETTRSGRRNPQVHKYTELATGLHYLQNGQWVESRELIGILPQGGAAATNGQHQVYFPSDIYNGVIEVIAADGAHLKSRPLGLSYFDGTNSVLIAELTNSVGQILPSENQVIYTNAFTDFGADLVCTYRKSGFESDVVFREQPPVPEQFGLSSTNTRLQLLTEFFDTPEPAQQASLTGNPDGLQDYTLNFGVMQMIRGKAFITGDPAQAPRPGRTPVYKTWAHLQGRTFLVEEVPFRRISPQLLQLPASTNAIVPIASANSILHKVSNSRLLPTLRMVQASTNKVLLTRANLNQRPGVVLDYVTVNANQSNFTFQADTTYLISGVVFLLNTNVIEGGTVVKFDGSGFNYLENVGTLIYRTAPYRPAVLTSMDDDSMGETIGSSSGSPTVQSSVYGLVLDEGNSVSGMRFCYGQAGISPDGNPTLDVWDCQFLNCYTAVDNYAAVQAVRYHNVLFSGCTAAFVDETDAGLVVTAEQVTADVTRFWDTNYYGPSALKLTNSIIVGNIASGPTLTTNSVAVNPAGAAFQVAGGGHYYLTNDSPYRNAGTTNISSALLTELRQKTTYPPIVYFGTTLSNAVDLSAQAQRDTDRPDLGYHYDPLDYIFGDMEGTTDITFAAGTAVGWFFSSTDHGIHMGDNTTVSFNGTEQAPDYFVRCDTVQEQDLSGTYRVGGITGSTYSLSSNIPDAPVVSARFLRCSILAGDNMHFRDYYGILVLRATDCEFWTGSLGGYDSLNYYTNCLFDRIVAWQATGESYPTNIMRNCTLRGGFLHFQHWEGGAPYWYSSIRDCAFDGMIVQTEDPSSGDPSVVDYAYNAFLQGADRTDPTNAHDVIVTNSFNWQFGALGNYYLPTSSLLIDAGSRTADLAGLYHFTTQTDQTKETTSTVDIGYHYVALDGNGNPVDTDSDGIPDYLEDANGNGIVDSGETDWQSASDPGLKVIITRPKNGSVLP
jgi:hypothetical protein